MNSIKTADIKVGDIISSDSFILDNLFFLPQNTPLTDIYINLLIKWNIEDIITKDGINSKNENSKGSKENNTKNDKEVEQKDTQKVESPKQIISNIEGIDVEFFNKYKNWIFLTMSFFTSIIKNKTIDKDRVSSFIIEIRDTILKQKSQFLKIIAQEIEGIPYIYKETLETMTLAILISKSMNYNVYTSNNLIFATLFHDIGMLTVPINIINKKEALTEEEIIVLKSHTIKGFKYLQAVGYSPVIASGALQHHERLDGEGYPYKVRGDKISEVAKIISVLDSYCASISEKPSKPIPIHAKAAVQELLKGSGTQYDTDVINHLIKNISFYPIGITVILSDERIASVLDISGVPMRPIVKIDGTNEELDLSKNQNIFIKGVVKNT